MALTFVEKVRGTTMGKAFRVAEVTHDGSITTIEATDLDLNYIDYAIVNGIFALSAMSDYDYLSGATSGTYVTLANALTSTTKCVIRAWGW